MRKIFLVLLILLLSASQVIAQNYPIPNGGNGGNSSGLPSGAQANQLLGHPNINPAWVNGLFGIQAAPIANAYMTPFQLLGTEPSVLPIDVTGGNSTLLLPPAISFPNKIYYIINYDPSTTGNTLTLTANGVDQIQGFPSFFSSVFVSPLGGPYGIISDGASKWYALVGGSGDIGTVTHFSSGNLAPLFTTSVSNAGSTPAQTFALSSVAAATFFGNTLGSSHTPAFHTVGTTDQVLGVAHTGGGLEGKTIAAGSGITVTPTAGTITIAATMGGSLPSGQNSQLLNYLSGSATWAYGLSLINSTPATGATMLTGAEQSVQVGDVTAGGGICNFTLPDSATFPNKIYYFVIVDPSNTENYMTITAAGTDQVMGAYGGFYPNFSLVSNNSPYGVISDGAGKWYILTPKILDTEHFSGQTKSILATNGAGQSDWLSTASINGFSSYAPFLNFGSDNTGFPNWFYGPIQINATPNLSGGSLTGAEQSYIISDTSSGSVSFTLPAVSSFPNKLYVFENINGPNQVILTPAGSDTIEGLSSLNVNFGQTPIGLISDGVSTWRYVVAPVLFSLTGSGSNSVVIDTSYLSSAIGTDSIAIGNSCITNSPNDIAIGQSITTPSSSNSNVAIGNGAVVGGVGLNANVAIGYGASATGGNSVAIGSNSTDNAVASIFAIGSSSFPKNFIGFDQLLGSGGGTSTAAGAGAGSGPTIALTSGSNNTFGQVSVTTGSSPSASSVVVTITTTNATHPYTHDPFVILTPANAATAALTGTGQVWVTSTVNDFSINVGSSALTGANQYIWNYHVGD
jgi:Head domain of trimeric autotransporter adhesin